MGQPDEQHLTPADILMSKHVVKLAQLSKSLQVSSQALNATIHTIEDKLRELNLGVEAEARLTPDWVYGYGRIEGRTWGLFVEVRGRDGQVEPHRTAIIQSSRGEKVRCLLTLPKILDALVAASEKMLQELEHAHTEVASFTHEFLRS